MNPIQLLLALGHAPPVRLPRDFASGPFELTGTFDYDAGAHTVCSFKTAANIPELDPLKTRLQANADNPSVILAVDAIEIIFIDKAVVDDSDPEDVREVFENLYLEHTIGETTRRWKLFDGCHFDTQPVAMVDSDLATTTYAYRYKIHGEQQFAEGTLLFDLEDDAIVAVKAGANSANQFGANADVRIRLHGAAWSKSMKGWKDTSETYKGGNSCGTPDAQLADIQAATAVKAQNQALHALRYKQS
jgi:hypothetical protein